MTDTDKQKWTAGLNIRDYGEPVSLEAAECQFALMDSPDGAPVAYVYRAEDAALYAASPDMAEALRAICEALEDGETFDATSIAKHAGRAALAKAGV